MEISQIKKSYQRKQKLYNTKQEKIRKLIDVEELKIIEINQEIDYLKKESDKLTYPDYIKNYLKPLAEELLKHKYFKKRYYKIFNPSGLTHKSAIHFYRVGVDDKNKFKKDNCISVYFRPMDLVQTPDLFLVDFTKDSKRYKKGTIGYINDLNHPNVPMPKTIKELIKFIKNQNKHKK